MKDPNQIRLTRFRTTVTACVIALISSASVVALAADMPKPVRVALMDFSTDDLSYRSAQAATEFTALLQASLRLEPQVVWVEREQLAHAADELGLAGAGLVERAEAARAGYWNHADWMLFGTIISATSNAPARLSLEAVDLARAITLGELSLVLPASGFGPFRTLTNDLAAATMALAPWFRQEAQEWRAEQQRPSVAYLGNSGAGRWLYNAVRQIGARWIDFHRAGRALSESELTLSGLVQAEPDACAKLADLYVWDEPTQPAWLESASPLRADGAWDSQARLIVVWTPHGMPKTIAQVRGFHPPPDEIGRIAALLLRELRSNPQAAANEKVLTELASRFTAAILSQSHQDRVLSLGAERDRTRWFNEVQALESALFVDPADQVARELWLRTRWAGCLSSEFRSAFNFERYRFQAWGEFLDRFTTNRLGTNLWTRYCLETNSVAAEFLQAADLALQYTARDIGKSRVGIPDDVDGQILRAWQHRIRNGIRRRAAWLLCDEGVNRYSQVLVEALVDDLTHLDISGAAARVATCEQLDAHFKGDLSWSSWLRDYSSAVTNLYTIARQPERARALLERAEQALAQARHDRDEQHRNVLPITLPRADDESTSDEWLSTGGASFAPPTLTAQAEPVRFPPDFQPEDIVSLGAFGGRVWAVVKGKQLSQTRSADPALANQLLTPNTQETYSIWSIPETGQTAERAPQPAPVTRAQFPSDAPWLAPLEGELWASDTRAIVRWRPDLERPEPLDPASLPARTMWMTAADAGPWRYLIGGEGICRVSKSGGTWTAGRMATGRPEPHASFPLSHGLLLSSGDRLLFLGAMPLLFQISSASWTNPTDLSPIATNIGHLRAAAAAETGEFWLASELGIYRLAANNETAMVYEYHRAPTLKRPSSALPGVGLGPKLTLPGTSISPQMSLALWEVLLERVDHKGAPAFCRMPEAPRVLARDGEFLWAVLGVGPIALLHPASSNWVGILHVPLTASIDCMTVTESALWLGLQAHGTILRVPKRHLLAIPRSQWVSNSIGRSEFASASPPNPTTRAVLSLFNGDARQAVGALASIPETDLTAEQRFLLALSYDDCGLNQTAQQLRHEDALVREFPNSIYTRALRYEQLRHRIVARPPRPSPFLVDRPNTDQTNSVNYTLKCAKQIVADYDLDGNGRLDQEELALACRLEPNSVLPPANRGTASNPWFSAYNSLLFCNAAVTGSTDAAGLAGWWDRRNRPLRSPPFLRTNSSTIKIRPPSNP